MSVSTRRQLLAVLTAAFLLFQQAILLAPAVAAQTKAKLPGTKAPAPKLDEPGSANLSITTLGAPITQNFDSLLTSGTANPWTDDSTIPGWFAQFTTTTNPTTYRAGTGTDTAGAIYSFGAAATNALTERAFGSISSGTPLDIYYALKLTNNTGATITSFTINYNGEQWRNGGNTSAHQLDFQYQVANAGTITDANAPATGWTDFDSLDFVSPIVGATATALDGNAAANRTAKSATLTVTVNVGQEIWLRFKDINDAGNDHGLAIDDFSVTANGAATPTPTPTPAGTTVSVNDVSQDEGSGGGTTTFNFTISLSTASHGGVTMTASTADGTALDGSDYQGFSTPVVFPNGTSSLTIPVSVNADSVPEPNETFFLNITNPSGNLTIADGQGQATIQNDDIAITPIHDIQGNGAASPLVGQTNITTTGIVTMLKTGSNAGNGAANGYFLQDPVADADPNTSEGIFVFTSSVPTVAVGDSVRVTGTVAEFNGLTELTTITNTLVLSTGNTLPAAVTLDSTILDPSAPPDQSNLEKFEGMRLTGTLRTVSPNNTFYEVYAVLPAVPREQVFREPGIPAGDPVPPDPTSGTPDPNIPIWDRNPEKLLIDTNGRAGSPNVAYTSNVTFTNLSGPLDYGFGEYRLVPDAAPTASANMTAVAVPVPDANEFTVAGYNIENFNNNATQRQKAADTVRNLLHSPDIIGAVEIFDLADLEALRDEINNDAVAASQPNPQYEAFLVEQDGTSEDSDQDVGFLVKTSRVSVTSVTQEREEETFVEPGGGTAILHDRPPLVLDAIVDPSGAAPQRVLVVVNHLRSFIDVELVAGEGPRVREKRKKQAESLADLLNDLQTANPGVPVISVGDYNAFQFSSGYDDSLSVIKGTPTADDQIVVDQSPDLVEPNFINLIETLPAAERYSFFFSDDGAMQTLDHHVVNTVARGRNTRTAIARVNSDFPEAPAATYANNAATPERNSDHDPVVSYYRLGAAQAPGSLIISEFRFRGPGSEEEGGEVSPSAPGTTADNDEFVELYNNTDSDITVLTIDGSAGWALVAADGVTRFIIPNLTVIPARGHFLATNVDGYSLGGYAGGDDVLLPANLSAPTDGYNFNIPDGSGIALFNTANPANFTLGNRLDAAGYSAVDPLYREGAGFPAPGAEATSDLQYSFVRKVCLFAAAGCGAGFPSDTSNNSADFVVVNTDAAETTLGAMLGAPGPEALTSPLNGNAGMPGTLLDPSTGSSLAPNRVRDFSPVTNGDFGTISFRRTVTNNTGSPVRYLAFRIVEITTLPAPTGVADLRALDSEDVVVEVNGSPVDVRGTFVEQPPNQPNGGGLDSTLAVGFIDVSNQLDNGDSVNVEFRLGIMRTGRYRFYVNIEMLNDGLVPAAPVPPSGKKLKTLPLNQRQHQRPRSGSK